MAVKAHYEGYVNALKSTDHATVENQRGPFMEFKPRDPANQAKQSAMSSSWQGLESSEASIARGDYDLNFRTKDQAPIQKPTTPQPKTTPAWNCSIQ
jgi:hypothetical protein